MELPTYFDALMNRSPIPAPDITTFLREMRRTPSGPLITSKLLAGKIQSTSEAQAIQAFAFLEAALESESEGSIEFRTEIGRYRFLNEIIRILSPKYLGDQTTLGVKERAVKFLYDASGVKRKRWFPSEHSKIDAVYNSLVVGTIIPRNPKDASVEADADAELQKSIFDRAENAIMLKKLLQSKDPADLQAANRLIKNLADEETKRNERRAELHSLIDRIDTSTSLLTEMLVQSRIDAEIVEELADTCRSLREKLGGIATETNDETTSLLQASENIEKVLELYERKKNCVDDKVDEPESPEKIKAELSLADELLIGLGDINLSLSPYHNKIVSSNDSENLLNLDVEVYPSPSSTSASAELLQSDSTLDEIGRMSRELMEQNLVGIKNHESKKTDKTPLSQLLKPTVEPKKVESSHLLERSGDAPFLDLDFLDRPNGSNSLNNNDKLMPTHLNAESKTKPRLSSGEDENLLLVLSENPTSKGAETTKNTNNKPQITSALLNSSNSSEKSCFSLNSVKEIDLELIDLIEDVKPVEIDLEEDSKHVNLTLTFGGFPKLPTNVYVIVITLANRSPSSTILNYVFQLLPPKGLQVKLLPPSCMELPLWKKSFLPPPVLTQVALIMIPPGFPRSKSKMKFILSYCLGEETSLHNKDFEIPSTFF